ncbi:MAG: pirin family protein [Deltaproteobacteria bacterium]|nr:pirin family protein [Deltaproteobacteria bacterium]
MLTLRPAAERGHFDHGWLDTRHTFSFAEYRDPAQMGFRALRVINQDRVRPGQGFGTHGHRDMEILSYVLDGALAHRDSTGGGGVLRPGEVQRMSAGTGVTHSEFNGSRDEEVHFLQIWIVPDRPGHEPSYEQRAYPAAERRGALRLVASPDGAAGSTAIHRDARVYASLLPEGARLRHPLAPGRAAWVQVARGRVEVNGALLGPGDGAAVEGEEAVALAGRGPEEAELLLFDLD